jgi:hypothetical protein
VGQLVKPSDSCSRYCCFNKAQEGRELCLGCEFILTQPDSASVCPCGVGNRKAPFVAFRDHFICRACGGKMCKTGKIVKGTDYVEPPDSSLGS